MQHCAGFISAGSLYMFLTPTPETCRNKNCTMLHQVGFYLTYSPERTDIKVQSVYNWK